MKRLFRPGTLVLMSVVLALGAGVLVFWPFGQGAGNRAIPQPVPAGDQEIVWLNPATNAVSWERFVAAVWRLKTDCPSLGVTDILDANAFPNQTAVEFEKARPLFRNLADHGQNGNPHHERLMPVPPFGKPGADRAGSGRLRKAALLAAGTYSLDLHLPSTGKTPKTLPVNRSLTGF